jgi:phosphohistidine swiveling domain-containing protein
MRRLPAHDALGAAGPIPAGAAGGSHADVSAPRTVSGFAFSRNPVTGLDEVVVEAVAVPGSERAKEELIPERWVYRWGDWVERPLQPILDERVVRSIVVETRDLEAARRHPVNVEWSWEGASVRWLEARPIAGLDDVRVYSNRIAREVLPGLIKPLVWSVNVPVVNRAWITLLEELVGPTDLTPGQLARQFGYRAYFDMAALGRIFEILGMPRESLELLLGLPRGSEPPRFRPSIGTLRHVPRMLAAGARLASYGPRVRGDLRVLAEDYARLERVDLTSLDDASLLAHVDQLMTVTEQAAYANIVTPSLMNLYAKLLERTLSRAGLDPHTVDPAAGRADRAAFDPRPALDEISALLDALGSDDLAALEADGASALETRESLAWLRASVDAFVERFGHLAASGNDFSSPPWREDPDGVVRMILDHRGSGAARSDMVDWETVAVSLPALERPLARTLWVRAGAYRVYREAVSFRYTRGYALFRPAFLELGRRLADRRALAVPDDVFYLTLDELRAVVAAGPAATPQHETVARRRVEMAEAATLDLPEIIFGDDFVPGRQVQAAGLLRGIPTSRGHYRGTARVVRDRDDFPAVQPGDIIVIPHSDVAWTPLFARAGAVVAESGGLLSHSSIVAREHGIPCVVSLERACARIPDRATVAVDGYTGLVTIE